jgi:cation-transporting ATPase E
VRALKNKGHSVAMTGDGVNDVLALKESDCSIAMASGSEAARNVADLVLLDSDFTAMPYIVGEGRRCINNIGRSASLFLVKTVFATILGACFVFLNLPYIFVPIQLTLISGVTIGIPAFFLALEPNDDRVQGNFLYTIIRRALPGGLTIVCNVLLIEFLGWILRISQAEISTVAVLATTAAGFLVLREVSRPMTPMRRILMGGLWIVFLGAVFILPELFSLVALGFSGLGILAGALALCLPVFIIWSRLCAAVLDKKERE